MERYERHCGDNGLLLPAFIKREINRKIDGNADTAIEATMENIALQGLSSLDSDSYEALSDELDAWSECLSSARAYSAARMCSLHERAMRHVLGDIGYLVIEAKVEAAGDDLELVKSIVSDYLDKKGTRELQSASQPASGGAFQATGGDADKDRKKQYTGLLKLC